MTSTQFEAVRSAQALPDRQMKSGRACAEHGVGALKAHKLPNYQDPAALAMMRAIKQALDPQNLLNPGKVLA